MRTVNHEDEARRHFTEAAKYYLESAETFPQDDEKHSCEYSTHLFITFSY